MMQPLATTFAYLVAIAAASTPLSAQQGQNAALVGTVIDSSGAVVARAQVSVAAPSLIGGRQSMETDGFGAYRFVGLVPGSYEVLVNAAGFTAQTRHEVSLPPGSTITADFILSPTGITETVDVSAAGSILDVHTSSASTIVPTQLLDNLPLDRTVFLYVNLVPGVIKDVAFGSAVRSNPFTLDGASGNEVKYGRSSSSPSASWIQEVQVVTVGADAQFGEYTGALANAITRSGSNVLSGAIEYWTTRTSWTANNRGSLTPDLANRFRPLDVLERWSTDARIGGPLRKDQVWLFGGVDIYHDDTRPAGFAAVAKPPEDAVQTTRAPKALGKVTAAVRQNVRLEAYVGRDINDVYGVNAGPRVRPEALSTGSSRETLLNGRWTWIATDRTLVEARYGGQRTHSSSGPVDPSRRSGPSPHYDAITGVSSVNVSGMGERLTEQASTTASLTRFARTAGGQTHESKAGFEYETSRLIEKDEIPGGMFFTDLNGVPDQVLIWPGDIHRGRHSRYTMFVQDAWNPVTRLTVNAGVRAGLYRGAVPGFATQFAKHSISPRIGAAWDVTRSHVLTLRGHYGRYHEAMVTGYYDYLDPLSQSVYVTAKVAGPSQFEEISRSGGLNVYSLDRDLRYPYADEWVGAIDRSLGGHVSVTAQYIRRRYGSIVGFVGSMSDWTPVSRQDPGRDGAFGTADDGKFVTIHINPGTNGMPAVMTNPQGAFKHYNGLQLIATRRARGKWLGQASYTFSRTRANFNNGASSNAGSNDLGMTGIYMNPNRAFNSGPIPTFDFTHEVKALGTVRVDPLGGLNVSAVYRYQSGAARGREVRFAGVPGTILVEPRGMYRAAATNTCDLRVEKTFHAGLSTVGAFADFFNVGNQGIPAGYNNLSGPNFGVPNAWSDPRVARAGLRLMF